MNARPILSMLAVAGLAAVLPSAGGCNDPAQHVYMAQLFEADRMCLDTYSALDVSPGGGGDTWCAPVCLVGGGAIYVSSVCPPYPSTYDTSGTDPGCAAALAAFTRGDECLDDGGSSNPPMSDASTDDAGTTDDGATDDAPAADDAPTSG